MNDKSIKQANKLLDKLQLPANSQLAKAIATIFRKKEKENARMIEALTLLGKSYGRCYDHCPCEGNNEIAIQVLPGRKKKS